MNNLIYKLKKKGNEKEEKASKEKARGKKKGKKGKKMEIIQCERRN